MDKNEQYDSATPHTRRGGGRLRHRCRYGLGVAGPVVVRRVKVDDDFSISEK